MYSISRDRQHLGQHEKVLSVAKQIFMHEGVLSSPLKLALIFHYSSCLCTTLGVTSLIILHMNNVR